LLAAPSAFCKKAEHGLRDLIFSRTARFSEIRSQFCSPISLYLRLETRRGAARHSTRHSRAGKHQRERERERERKREREREREREKETRICSMERKWDCFSFLFSMFIVESASRYSNVSSVLRTADAASIATRKRRVAQPVPGTTAVVFG